LAEHTKQPSPVTPHIDCWCLKCPTNHNCNAIEDHKLMILRSF